MAAKRTSSSQYPPVKGGKLVPALCNILGTLILLAVILTAVPLAVPRFFGYEIFNVETGSMEPALPVGSVVYVKPVEPTTIKAGDIIAFYSNGTVITHRVVENRTEEDKFVTKGDANAIEDLGNVNYGDVIGVVKYHFPVLGSYLMLYSQQMIKIYLLCLAGCGVLFNIIASRIRIAQAERYQEELAQYRRRQKERERAELEKNRD
jgi:signal peptidase I